MVEGKSVQSLGSLPGYCFSCPCCCPSVGFFFPTRQKRESVTPTAVMEKIIFTKEGDRWSSLSALLIYPYKRDSFQNQPCVAKLSQTVITSTKDTTSFYQHCKNPMGAWLPL
ncbi:hypothetical protein ILYODFUR_034013 [Ilyodon furcidens]|uniref:Uncharacterized protein n=1 Tax=Ilyodon furcidens TaxID=33524 RepID=A0ABV0TDE4_9TELE